MNADQIAYLLMMARDVRAEGDTLVTEQTKINMAHGSKLEELWEMAEETRRILEHEMQRFARYLPKNINVQTAPQQTHKKIEAQ
jgi:hypothetical protein